MKMNAHRRVRASSLEKRRRILDAAAKVLARRGYAETTLQEVANEYGAYAASLYYYFSSREDLVKEVLLLALDRFDAVMQEAVDALPTDCSPLDKVKAAVRAMLLLNLERDDYAIAYNRNFDQAPAAMAAEIHQARRGLRISLAALIRAAQEAGQVSADLNVSLARLLVIGMTHWVSKWSTTEDRGTPAEISDQMTEMLVKAIQ